MASRDHGIFFGLSNQKEVSMLSRFGRPSLVSFLFLHFAATMLFAQSGAATLTGTVIDQAGAVLAGVKVVVRDPETGFERETLTNQSDNYNLPGLRPARYEITAELRGFRKRSQRGFVVEVNQTARLDMEMQERVWLEVMEWRSPPS